MRTLADIAHNHPSLIYQAKGYDEPDRSMWSDADLQAADEVASILRGKVKGFKRFQNFVRRKDGQLQVRVQHAWDWQFTGVGYFDVMFLDSIDNDAA